MLNYKEFRELIIRELKCNHSDYIFSEEEVRKVNENYYGVAICRENKKCGSVINLTEYYQKYLYKEMTVQEMLWEIWDIYNQSVYHLNEIEEKAQMIYSFEETKKNIYCKVVNKSLNEELINMMPHRELQSLNLLCLYYIDFGNGIVTAVNNQMLAYWGVNEHQIHKIAIQNMKNNCIPYCSRIASLIGIEDDNIPMWVVGVRKNNSDYMGASIILLKSTLNDMLEKNDIPKKCYIIPSSIHELIIVPANGAVDKLNEMIRNVNETILQKSDILSEVAYHFDREKNEISILN